MTYQPKIHLVGIVCGSSDGRREPIVVPRIEFLRLPEHRRCGACSRKLQMRLAATPVMRPE
jgi:hypothetical protein